ncbi:hypothetical protein QGN29_08025 [Temperatibacter marinus]|uniref:Uncharacterized protein n=1 Tax=Temperatibacter marinus TaxID=1456591 RepID=A0AA52H7W6_9PROT|nr:hypothetical protein [Temperatibacter marinus]WND01506.1 hypothetical protein QGN29_08025 [Temperatibacter marinus]
MRIIQYHYFLASLMLILFGLMESRAEETFADDRRLRLIVVDLPKLTDHADAAYAKLFKHLQDEKIIGEWRTASQRRAHKEFIRKQSDCIAPASHYLIDNYKLDPTKFLLSTSFNQVAGYIIKTDLELADNDSLPILGTVGFSLLYEYVGEKYSIRQIKTYKSLANLLKKKRIHAGYVNMPDLSLDQEAYKNMPPLDLRQGPIWKSEEKFLCHKDAENQFQKLNLKLNHMIRDGSLKTLLSNAYFRY